MRDLPDVIDKIIEKSSHEKLNERLKKIKKDCGFTAPEVMYIRWGQVAEALNEYIPNPALNKETQTIANIFAARD